MTEWYILHGIVTVIKQTILSWLPHANMRYFRTYYFTGRLISNDDIKVNLAEVGYEDTNFTEVAHDNK